ncbi:hypothetical protein CVV68_01295 [Arthrobacter livingstonensis]|uniref:Alkaline shock response membrane anchor protein AmaP n=1 Tax=Arthrobacter livingstonensis TaxID=670078 RepID=A0A2V5LFB6_9MICC|nr:hypothetical protein [Arthrobacter livingstonensis]PYI69772.1 hypothetical protein CVV68_01295 [Arthrobacter livingstonensis]
MRQTAGTLNRTWLAILGVLVLAAGITGLLQAAGTLQTIAPTPSPGTRVVTGELHPFFAQPWLIALILVIGVLVGVLALWWIIAQIPRKNPAGTYRLQHEGAQGRTSCDPSVLAAAVEEQVNTLPGVVTASALLRGTANEPDLTLKVTINDRTDVRALLRHLETSTLPQLSTTLEAPLYRRRLQIDVSTRTQSTGTVVHSTGTILH